MLTDTTDTTDIRASIFSFESPEIRGRSAAADGLLTWCRDAIGSERVMGLLLIEQRSVCIYDYERWSIYVLNDDQKD